MTHRPRTDLFSSLPHLLALANLKELMDHHSLEEHALRLQAEAMTKLQYLQCLLQTPATSSIVNPSPNPSNNHFGGLNDMETLKFLASLSQLEASGTATAFGSQSFPRLPELQNPACSFETTPSKDKDIFQAQVPELTVFGQAEDSPSFPWQPSTSPKPSPHQLPINDAAPIATSSYDAVSCSSWPDILLDDPSFSSLLS